MEDDVMLDTDDMRFAVTQMILDDVFPEDLRKDGEALDDKVNEDGEPIILYAWVDGRGISHRLRITASIEV